MRIKVNEYIILKEIDKTARVIEIYSAPGENDRLFLICFPDGEKSYAFSSQVIPLDHG